MLKRGIVEIPLLTQLRLLIWAMLDDSWPSARSKHIGMYTELFSIQSLLGQLTLNMDEVYLL